MKKIFFITYFLTVLSNLCFAQQNANKTFRPLNQGVPMNKTQQQNVNEIDRLYNKYKNKETITIYSTFGELNGTISTEMNASNKPESIEIYGTTNDTDAISEIIYELIKQKLKQGYKHYSGNQVERVVSPQGVDYIKQEIEFNSLYTYKSVYDATYKRGSLYFRVDITYYKEKIKNPFSSKMNLENLMNDIHTYSSPTYREYYSFSITNGDNNRKGGKGGTNATKFDF
jgi:hypothetical protein